MPPKRIQKKTPMAAEFYIRFQGLRPPSLGELRIGQHAKFQQNRTIGGRVMAILPFHSLGPILGPQCG